MNNEHIYYNVEIKSKNNYSNEQATIASKIDNRSTPILLNPSEYTVSVVRASINGSYIPLFIYPTNGTEGNLTPNNNAFAITLKDITTSTTSTAYVQFVTTSPTIVSTVEQHYYIYQYDAFIDMINTCFQTVFDLFLIALPGTTIKRAPYMTFNPSNNLFRLNFTKDYINNVDIFFNNPLYNFFESFNVVYGNFNTVDNVKFKIDGMNNKCFNECSINISCTLNSTSTITSSGLFNPKLNGSYVSGDGILPNTIVSYVDANTLTLSQAASVTGVRNLNFTYEMLYIEQNYQTTYNWSQIKSIVITSTLIPVRSEYSPLFTDGSSESTLKILTDFEPPINIGSDIRNSFYYNPTAEYRRIDLQGTIALSNFDVNIYWKDVLGKLRPIVLPTFGLGASVKFLFEKKKKSFY
jgi:hypothetical protein